MVIPMMLPQERMEATVLQRSLRVKTDITLHLKGDLFDGGKYFSAEQYKGGASAPGDRADDSDIEVSNTAIKSAKTEVFAMSTDDQLVESETINQTVSGVNAGLIEGVQVSV